MKHLQNDNFLRTLLVSSIAAAALTACGGGGGSGGGNGNAGVNSSVDIQCDSSDTAGSPAKVALACLQKQRTSCGFKPFVENGTLNVAAENHALYIATQAARGKPEANAHYELDKSNTYYRGEDLKARLEHKEQQYATNFKADEQLTFTTFNTKASFTAMSTNLRAENTLRGLLSAPYHMKGLLDKDQDVGISYVFREHTNGEVYSVLEIVNAIKNPLASPNVNISDKDVVTYPCQNIAGTKTALYDESPNPFAERNLETNPIGQPIYIRVPKASRISLESATIKDAANQTVTYIPLTQANDINHLLQANELFLIPDKPLKAYVRYQVSYKVKTDDGHTYTDSFVFKTGAENTF